MTRRRGNQNNFLYTHFVFGKRPHYSKCITHFFPSSRLQIWFLNCSTRKLQKKTLWQYVFNKTGLGTSAQRAPQRGCSKARSRFEESVDDAEDLIPLFGSSEVFKWSTVLQSFSFQRLSYATVHVTFSESLLLRLFGFHAEIRALNDSMLTAGPHLDLQNRLRTKAQLLNSAAKSDELGMTAVNETLRFVAQKLFFLLMDRPGQAPSSSAAACLLPERLGLPYVRVGFSHSDLTNFCHIARMFTTMDWHFLPEKNPW